MITCRECIGRLKPDDPRKRSGKYRLCGCDYCNKPSYYRELEEQEPSSIEVKHIYHHRYIKDSKPKTEAPF